MYRVKDLFYTLQGEGQHAGRPAVFMRFAGCNLWSGREDDRAGAICQINCDTDFVGDDYGSFVDAAALARCAAQLLPDNAWDTRAPMIVLTGGEPTLQVDQRLTMALLDEQFYIALETNGTRPIRFPVDWVCVSPKAGTALSVTSADEVKLVYPQDGLDPGQVRDQISASSYRLQPMWGADGDSSTAACIDYCKAHPDWSLSVQTHKYVGIP